MAKSNRASGSPRPTEDEIGRRAYALYLERGSRAGHEIEDWLQAEAELTAAAGNAEGPSAATQPRRPEATNSRRESPANNRRALRQ